MDEMLPPHPLDEEVAPALQPVTPPRLLAPSWHTLAVLCALVIFAALSQSRSEGYQSGPHAALYATQMLTSWILFGAVVAGIYRREAFFTSTLRHKARSWRTEAARGAGIYLGFLVLLVTTAVIGVSGYMAYRSMHAGHALHSATDASRTNAGTANVSPSPGAADSISVPDFNKPPDLSRFGFRPKAVAAIAPRSLAELALWLLLSFTAGFSEEHIFRGYFLQQSLAMLSRWKLSPLLVRTLAVLISSMIFGSLHLYEGVGGAVVVTMLGAAYAVIALIFGNLRAVMVAHFLQDFVAGTTLFLLRGHGVH